jgi:hypothetical protein
MPEASPITPESQLAALLFLAAVSVLFFAAFWRILSKAGEAGWKSLIPVYNLFTLLKVSGKPGWWVVPLLLPILSIPFLILLAIGLSRSFGKGGWFAAGLALIPWVFFPVLGFSSDAYQGPGGQPAEEAFSTEGELETTE